MSNLYSVFARRFPENRQQPFLTEQSGKQISYAELEQRSAQLANVFVELGLRPGDRLAVQLHKSASVLLIYLAALRAGVIYLPLNTAYTERELRYFLTDAEPAMVIADPALLPCLQGLTSQASTPAQCHAIDAKGCGELLTRSEAASAHFETLDCSDKTLAAILYTSGTTGVPKGAMLSHGNLASNALVLHVMWGGRADDVLLHALPIFHVHGLFVAVHSVLMAGASMHFLERFDEQAVIECLPKCSVMMAVPTHYTRLLASDTFNRESCAAMRLFISGSAPMLSATHRAFTDRTGQSIVERYGMTETAMLVSNPLQGERRPGTVGLALPGVVLRLVDDHQQAVAIGEVGSIQVRGPNVFQGYWRKPEKTAEDFTDDGFFITGDQGQLSADGYLTIVGRSKDMIISGGLNVYPKEVEMVLNDIAGVTESAVFAVPDDDFGEAVMAVIIADKNCCLDTVFAEAKQQLSNYKMPKKITQVEQLPRNTMGKVQKNKLRQQYAAAMK